MDGEAMINSIKNGDQPLLRVTQVSLMIQRLPNDIYSLIDSNKTAKDLWDALVRHMLGSKYGEQDRKATVLYEYETFKATEGELLLDTYIRYLQVINDLKKCGYSKDNWLKKKTVVVTSDPLALIAKKTNVSRSKEKVVVSSNSKGSEADDFNKDEQVVLAEDQAWMESSSDSDQEINSNMVFIAQIEKVLSDSEASSSSANEKISECKLFSRGISILLAVGTPSTGSGKLYSQWELSSSSGNALCILFPIGYSQNSNAYIILNKHTRKVKESLNVIFDETPPPSKTSPLVDDDLDEEGIKAHVRRIIIDGYDVLGVRTAWLGYTSSPLELRSNKFIKAAILKTFGGNEATKKTKKNLLKQQYGNFKAEGSETLEQTFNRQQVIVSQLQFTDIEIEQDDLNQKFLTNLAPEWLMHTIVWRNRSDLDTISLDDLYNHLKVYESEVQKKSEPNSQNMAFISSAKHTSGNEKLTLLVFPLLVLILELPVSAKTLLVLTLLLNPVGLISQRLNALTAIRSVTLQGSAGLPEAKTEEGETTTDNENHALIADEETPTEFALMAKNSAESEACTTIESSPDDAQNRNPSITVAEASPSTISSKPFIKFVKANNSPTKSKTDKVKTAKKPLVKYDEQYQKPTKKPNVRGNQRNWNNLKSHQLGPNFVMKKKACFNCSDFNHLAYDYSKRVKNRTSRSQNNTHKSFTPRPVVHKHYKPPMRSMRPNMNAARTNRTSFNNSPAHSYTKRPFQRTSTVRAQYRGPRVPPISRIFLLSIENFPLLTENFPLVAQNFPLLIWERREKFSQNNIDDKGYWDSGCSRHMTGNISYLSDYEPFDGGYVSFGQGGCKITGKGTIKTGKLEFENVYFVKDLKNFKLLDDTNVLLRTPIQHDMYSIDLNNIISHKDLTCLVVKAFVDECMIWHMRLGHLNCKTMNRLVRHNLVRGLPSKCFENSHTCTACLKGKQHKASCKSKLVNSMTKPLPTLHMDLFSPTSKGVKREFSNARTPQKNGVAEKRNRTLIEAARTMLADAKLPVTFWAKAVNTACFVQNRVLVNKCHNKTPYELFNGRTPAIGFLKPFGYHVMILNTLDNFRKFEAKRDEGFFIGYSMSSKAFRVFNKRTKRIEENLHVDFLENKAIKKGAGPNWLFDIDSLTKFMNYVPVVVADESNGVEADVSNMETTITASLTPTLRIHKDHPKSQITGLVDTPIQTKNKSKEMGEQKAKKISDALQDPSWVEVMQEELLQFKSQNVWTLVDCPKEASGSRTYTRRGIDYDEVFTPVARIEAIRLFLAYASFMSFTVYQMDVKSAFLYGTIDEEVYVMQPPGFQDPEFPVKVYKVEKAMYIIFGESKFRGGLLGIKCTRHSYCQLRSSQ
nr:retrovirus-related Pol polyprotein from transposon TNT 1-94 [Tanacetum cinerariifolium]